MDFPYCYSLKKYMCVNILSSTEEAELIQPGMFCVCFLFPVFDCNFESPCELEYSFSSKDQEAPNKAWLRVSAEDISQLNIPDVPERDHSENTPKGKMNTTMSCLHYSGWF